MDEKQEGNFIKDYSEIWAKAFDPNSSKVYLGQFKDMCDVWSESITYLFKNPEKLIDEQKKLSKSLFNVMTGSGEEEAEDRRFKSDSWKSHVYFDVLKNSYLTFCNHAMDLVDNVEYSDSKKKDKLHFYTKQVLDAMSPTNFIATNPDLIKKTMETKGDNLLKGYKNLVGDLSSGKGHLNIKMTDENNFVLGKNIATTKGKVVFKNKLIELIYYEPTTTKAYEIPLLVVPPWINKYYILDLSEKNSLVKWIVDQGFPCFIISWKNPSEQQDYSFDDYLEFGTLAAISEVLKYTKQKKLNLLGYCIGGTLLSVTNAYLAAKKQDLVNSTSYMATLIDFSEPGDLGIFIDEEQIANLDSLMKSSGAFNGRMLANTFNFLRANDLFWSYYINNYLKGEQPTAFDLLYWNSDFTNLPTKMHSFYLRNMYLENNLKKGKIKLKDVKIDIKSIKIPAFFVSTEQDHITPWASTYKGALLHSGKVDFVLGGSGHIAGIVNPPKKNKYFYATGKLAKTAASWNKDSVKHDGSWWPYWAKWLKKYSGKQVKALKPYKSGTTYYAAPGKYVLEKV